MFTKIATLVIVLTFALGGVGIVAVSAQADTADGGIAAQTKTMTAAKYAGEETLGVQTKTMTAAKYAGEETLGAQTKTMTAAKYAGEETPGAQTQTQTATQTFAYAGDMQQIPWAFCFGLLEDFVPGIPWTIENDGALEDVTGFGFGGRVDLAPKGSIDD